jgi:ketosteroid isomerase-like protein
MPAPDLERFRAGYERNMAAVRDGDIERAFAWIPPDFEWHVLAESLPLDLRPEQSPVLRGPDEVLAYFRELSEDWNWRPEPKEFELQDDGTIVVHAVGHITGRVTGLRGEVRFTQIWELREDGVPVRARERLDDYWLEGTRSG